MTALIPFWMLLELDKIISDQLVDHSIDSLLVGKDKQSLSIVGKDIMLLRCVVLLAALSKWF